MFDEIQNAPMWQKFIRRLYDNENYEIYITGSSAKLLSKEIATELRGRIFNYEIYPSSFKEFLRAHDIEVERNILFSDMRYKIQELFQLYLLQGGFPETININPELKYKIIQSHLDLVMFKDVIERYQVTRPDILLNMVRYLVGNMAREFSIHGYFKLIKSQGIKIGKDYLYLLTEYLADTYYFFFVEKFSHKMKSRAIAPKDVIADSDNF